MIPLFQRHNPSQSVQRALDELHARCSSERFRGLIFLLEGEDGEQVIGTSGVFATDLDRAASAAQAGFNCLLGHSKCIEDAALLSKLPRELRKEGMDEMEQRCAVVACNMRQ